MPPSNSKVAYAESSAVHAYGFPASSQRVGMWVAPKHDTAFTAPSRLSST